MKRKLICIMAIAFTTWIIRAALNPHITELDLSIDGVADYDEFYEPSPSITPKGPGGFVCSNGWHKITLKAVGVNDPMKTRLNWNSTRLEVWTATNGGTQVLSPTLWDPASSMPTQLWVKGVSSSATGPTKDASGNWTNCGPETLCLEAINNGADPTTPGTYYDRVAFTVYQVDSITVMPKNAPVGWTPPVPVTIGAGAIHSPAHQADVTIQVQPTVAGIPIDVSLSGGLSYQPGKAAELTVGTQAATGGGAVVTVLTGTNGTISGELTSSDVNNMECWIHASATETNVRFTWDEYPEPDEWTFAPGYLPVPGVLTNHLVLRHHRDGEFPATTNGLPWQPLNGHDIRFFVEKVEYWDADGNLCETNNTAEAPADVSVWATFPTNPVTTDVNGHVTELLTIVTNGNLFSVTLVAYDTSVYREAATPPPAPFSMLSLLGGTGTPKTLAAPVAPPDDRTKWTQKEKDKSPYEGELDGYDALRAPDAPHVTERDEDTSGILIQPDAGTPAAKIVVKAYAKSGFTRKLDFGADFAKVKVVGQDGLVVTGQVVPVPGNSALDYSFTVTQVGGTWNLTNSMMVTLSVKYGVLPIGTDKVKLVGFKCYFEKIISDQLPDVEANTLPVGDGTAGSIDPNNPMIMGNRNDNKAYLQIKASVAPVASASVAFIGVRKAGTEPILDSHVVVPSGKAPLSFSSVSRGLYEIVAGIDTDASGTLTHSEVGTVFPQKVLTITRTDYDHDTATISNGWVWLMASGMAKNYLVQFRTAGAAGALLPGATPTHIMLDPLTGPGRPTHPLGQQWSSTAPYLGTCPLASFPETSAFSMEFATSVLVNQSVLALISTPAHIAEVKAAFAKHPVPASEVFNWEWVMNPRATDWYIWNH
jgi:hypothetical protein